MTTIAKIVGSDVSSRLTWGGCPIMASAAASSYSGMIKGCAVPNVRVMAEIATGRSRNVINRFTCCRGPIMAAGAGSQNR